MKPIPVASGATDGKDGYRLKLEKVEATLSSFNDMLANISKKYNVRAKSSEA